MGMSQQELKKLLEYSPKTGQFLWLKISKFSKIKIGDIAGCFDSKGYRIIRINKKGYKAHRLAFLWMLGYLPENPVDHIDRIRDNNSWDNLREVSIICNSRNKNTMVINKSGVTGVCFAKHQNKWQAHIRIHGKGIYLGQFETILAAAKARWEAEKLYKFPKCNTTSSAYIYIKKHS